MDWKINDLFDFEYFLHRDGDLDEGELIRRDRKYFSQLTEDERKQPRSQVFRKWLEFRRELDRKKSDRLLPGDAYLHGGEYVFKLVVFLGLLFGGGLGFSLLIYDGVKPVNVSWYFLVLVILQLILVLFSVIWLFRRGIWEKQLSVLFPILGRIWMFAARRLPQWAKVSAGTRLRVEKALGLFRQKRTVYGSLFYWPLFGALQGFGICFNLGALGATLIKVFTSDLAFGWQSTLRLSSESLATMVKWLAWPWGWIPGAEALYPSLDQIEGSRIILKEGIYRLTNEDLVSWWPFLFLSVVFYGFIPRVLLWGYSRWAIRRDLQRIRFDHAACDVVYLRMATPRISVPSKPEKPRDESAFPLVPRPLNRREPSSPSSAIPSINPPPRDKVESAPVETPADLIPPEPSMPLVEPIVEPVEKPSTEVVVAAEVHEDLPKVRGHREEIPEKDPTETKQAGLGLIPEDIYDETVLGELSATLTRLFRVHEISWVSLEEGQELSGEVLGKKPWKHSIFLFQEAWQPPILEKLSFVQKLRTLLGERVQIRIALLGKPRGGVRVTPVKKEHFEVWERSIQALGDPYLFVFALEGVV